MNELTIATKVVLANTFIMYFKAHAAHWNIEGQNFGQFHDFFGSLYEELHGAVDVAAEQIRALDDYAPISLSELLHFATVKEDAAKPFSAYQFIGNLIAANDLVVASLNKLFELSTVANNQGLANFVAGRLEIHAKHAWMLNAYTKQ